MVEVIKSTLLLLTFAVFIGASVRIAWTIGKDMFSSEDVSKWDYK